MRKLTMLLWFMVLGCRVEPMEGEGTPWDAGAERDDRDASSPEACVPAEMPTCCVDCSDMTRIPVCTNGSWSCPPGTVDMRQCPSRPGRPACTLPPPPQWAYTYPGCAEEDGSCPRLKTLFCALESLRAQDSDCTQDSDCVAATVDGLCSGYGQCPPAMVSASGRARFEGLAALELASYCGGAYLCTADGGSCAYPTFVPRCRQARCVAEVPDAGP